MAQSMLCLPPVMSKKDLAPSLEVVLSIYLEKSPVLLQSSHPELFLQRGEML